MARKRESVSRTTVFILVVVMLAVSVLTSLTLITDEGGGAAKVKTEIVSSGQLGLQIRSPGSESGRVSLTVIEPN